MCDCYSHCIQVVFLTRDETSEELPNGKYVLAYATVLNLVFSGRHNLSTEGLLGAYVT